jgi:hypothetical protein
MAVMTETSGTRGEIPARDIPVSVEPAVGKRNQDDIATLAYHLE